MTSHLTTPLSNFDAERDIGFYQSKGYRLVETQEFAATSTLVDDLDEQFLLEQMLDEVKPVYRQDTEEMHYLLRTPFRYPPLKHGSRFGTRLMQSFFYASEQIVTALSEVAYYRFLFLEDMEVKFDGTIRTEHLLFSVSIESNNSIDLSSSVFEQDADQLIDPKNYQFCQQVGRWAVEEKQVDTIKYWSARCENGTNLAVFTPSSIISKQPENQQNWLCLSQHNRISFTRHAGHLPNDFNREQFLVDGKLPRPA